MDINRSPICRNLILMDNNEKIRQDSSIRQDDHNSTNGILNTPIPVEIQTTKGTKGLCT